MSGSVLSILEVLIINSSQRHDVLGAILSPLYRGRVRLHFTSRKLHGSEDRAEKKMNVCLWLDLFPWDS